MKGSARAGLTRRGRCVGGQVSVARGRGPAARLVDGYDVHMAAAGVAADIEFLQERLKGRSVDERDADEEEDAAALPRASLGERQ